MLRSGEVADAAGVNKETLRYYERRGLIDVPPRSLGGHRLYDDDTVGTLRMIKAAQRLGFTLNEVGELLGVGRSGRRRDGIQVMAAEKLAEVDDRIADLQRIRWNLVAALDAGCDDLRDCADRCDCPMPFSGLIERKSS